MGSLPPYLGLDLGATSGRAALGFLEGKRLTVKQISRFPNAGIQANGTLYWDVLSLWSSVLDSIRMCVREGYDTLSGIAVDTWGVDFGLLGPDGELMGNPVHYRDRRTEGIESKITEQMDEETLYRLTGMPLTRVATLSQLVAMSNTRAKSILDVSEGFLMMSDLFRYFLCGEVGCELTAVGGSQLANISTQGWCDEVFRAFSLPRRIAPRLVKPGQVVGSLLPEVSLQTGLTSASVVAAPGHDTASAIAALPMVEADCAFLSCGTWSVFGALVHEPILSPEALKLGFANEFGLDSILFVRNMMGLHLLENLRRSWMAKGARLSYAQIVKEAAEAEPFRAFVDVNDPLFFAGDSPESALESFLSRTGQKAFLSRAQMTRTVLEGLAFRYREGVRDLEGLIGSTVRRITVAGGGVRNRLLCQFVADATGVEVVAGPAEATVIGNLAIQAMATGHLENPSQVRELVGESFKLTTYKPRREQDWRRKYRSYQQIVEQARSARAST